MNGLRPIQICLLLVVAGIACSQSGNLRPNRNTDSSIPDATVVSVSTETPTLNGTAQDVPPLYFIYVIHTHVSGDYWPYENTSLKTINPQVADNIAAAIQDIAEILDRYGVKATWEVVYGTAQGLCIHQGQNHIFQQLVDKGHEIGLHVHDHDDYDRDYVAIRDTCGLDGKVTSGIKMFPHNLSNEEAQAYIVRTIETNIRDYGINVGTINLSTSSALTRLCPDEVVGVGNDMADEIGHALFPWRADIHGQNICADSPTSSFIFVEHLEMPAWTNRKGNQQADLFTEADFERLQALFDSALAYMETHKPTRVAVWGFVTHISEFAEGDQGEMPPDPATLALLDRFLAYVDTKRAEGRVVFAPASEIAEIAFPNP